MIRAKIIGAGGYGGVGIAELLAGHPDTSISALVDVDNVGSPLSDLYPHLAGRIDDPICAADDPRALEPSDVTFMATPDGVGMKLAPKELARGAKVVDMPRQENFSLCCGGGGGRVWMETPAEKRFSVLRVHEAVDAGAEVLATACPYCVSLLEDSNKTEGLDDRLEVADVTELLARSVA